MSPEIKTIIMQTYTPMAGEDIATTATKMVELATHTGDQVNAVFNEIELVTGPNGDPGAITTFYHAESERRAEACRNSPEGKAAELRHQSYRKQAAAAEAEGILPFTRKDEAKWQECVTKNNDPYGSCVMRYAARWANLMEAELAKGVQLAQCADKTSREADREGMTGFMYGCAVSILSVAWVHGEELRRWHNKTTQIGNEGDRANESGGVLNPALLCIGNMS